MKNATETTASRDYSRLYAEDRNFRRYVDRYAITHRISVKEALKHEPARAYAEYLEEGKYEPKGT